MPFCGHWKKGWRTWGRWGGKNSRALAITENGVVVGSAELPGGESHAFLWTREGGMRDLGTLGGEQSLAIGINRHNQVVGWSETGEGESLFVWTEARGMEELLCETDMKADVYGINDRGEIIGWVVNFSPWWEQAWKWIGQKSLLPERWHKPRYREMRMQLVYWKIPVPKEN